MFLLSRTISMAHEVQYKNIYKCTNFQKHLQMYKCKIKLGKVDRKHWKKTLRYTIVLYRLIYYISIKVNYLITVKGPDWKEKSPKWKITHIYNEPCIYSSTGYYLADTFDISLIWSHFIRTKSNSFYLFIRVIKWVVNMWYDIFW